MKRRSFAAACAAACLLVLTGCASSLNNEVYGNEAASVIVKENRRAASVLAKALSKKVGPGSSVLVTTIANLDRLNESSSMGRMISEQVAAGLVQYGVPVVEVKMANALFIRSAQGEMMLSREVKDLTLTHRAEYVIVGTYTVGGSTIYVTLKAVDPNTNVAHAAHSYGMPLDAFRKSI